MGCTHEPDDGLRYRSYRLADELWFQQRTADAPKSLSARDVIEVVAFLLHNGDVDAAYKSVLAGVSIACCLICVPRNW